MHSLPAAGCGPRGWPWVEKLLFGGSDSSVGLRLPSFLWATPSLCRLLLQVYLQATLCAMVWKSEDR